LDGLFRNIIWSLIIQRHSYFHCIRWPQSTTPNLSGTVPKRSVGKWKNKCGNATKNRHFQ